MQADFIEKRTSPFLSTNLNLSGVIEFESPSRLVKRTLKPFRETFSMDAEQLTIEKENTRTEVVNRQSFSIDRHPLIEIFVESFRSVLAGDADKLRTHFQVALSGVSEDWYLELTPLDARMLRHIEKVEVHGSGNRISEVVTTEGDGGVSRVDLNYRTVIES